MHCLSVFCTVGFQCDNLIRVAFQCPVISRTKDPRIQLELRSVPAASTHISSLLWRPSKTQGHKCMFNASKIHHSQGAELKVVHQRYQICGIPVFTRRQLTGSFIISMTGYFQKWFQWDNKVFRQSVVSAPIKEPGIAMTLTLSRQQDCLSWAAIEGNVVVDDNGRSAVTVV